MYDLITAVINELDQELVRRRCEATQLKLEQAALTDCEDVAMAGGKLPAWTEQIGGFWYTKIGAIVAKQDGRTLRRIGQAWMLVFANK